MDEVEGEDERLLRLTVAGDSEAFDRFYRRHEDPVLIYFLRRTNDSETAADLTAENFAAALRSAGRFKPERGAAVGWLFGIAGKTLAMSRRRGRVEDRARRRLKMEPLVLTDDDLERVDALIDAGAMRQALAAALAALPADQRQAIESRVLGERSYKELAGELRCSQAVVRKRVSRGLESMRVNLEEASG